MRLLLSVKMVECLVPRKNSKFKNKKKLKRRESIEIAFFPPYKIVIVVFSRKIFRYYFQKCVKLCFTLSARSDEMLTGFICGVNIIPTGLKNGRKEKKSFFGPSNEKSQLVFAFHSTYKEIEHFSQIILQCTVFFPAR